MKFSSIVKIGGFAILSYAIVGTALSIVRTTTRKTRYSDSGLEKEMIKRSRPDWVPKDAFVLDLHFHTLHSRDGALSPKQAVRWCVANGYNGMAITDHNNSDGVKEAQEEALRLFPDGSFVVIPGFEWTTGKFHANVFGIPIPEDMKGKHPLQWPNMAKIKEVSQKAHDAGGMMQYNHPPDPGCKGISREDFMTGGFDAIEIVNSRYDVRGTKYPYQKFCEDHSLAQTGGSDTHIPGDRPRVYLEVKGLSEAEKKDYKSVIKAIKTGGGKNTQIYFEPKRDKKEGLVSYAGMDSGRIGTSKILMKTNDLFTKPIREIPKHIIPRTKF